MMNALPILTDGPPLAGPGVMSDSYGSSMKAGLSNQSDGFKNVMAKVNAVSRVETPSQQSDISSVKSGSMCAQKDISMINAIATESTRENMAQMPDERQLQQLTVWVQQLPQDVQQMLARVVKQGDLQQLQWILQQIQTSEVLPETMAKEAAPTVERQSADADDVQIGSMDMQEAQKLALAIWLMSLNQVASVNGRQAVARDNPLGSNTFAGTGLDSVAQPFLMVSGDSSVDTRAITADQPAVTPPESLSGLFEHFRTAALSNDSKELRSVVERMMQVNAAVGVTEPSGVTAGQSAATSSNFPSSLSVLDELFPPDLFEHFRAAALSGDSGELRSVLELMMQVQANIETRITDGMNTFADSNQIKTAGSLDLTVNQGIVGEANAVTGDNSDSTLQSELMTVSVAGANQEKSAHRAIKQAVFADSKESLKDLSHGFIENEEVRQGQAEPISSLQSKVFENEISRSSEQKMEDKPLNNFSGVQQISGNQKMEIGDTLVIRRNVSVHAVTREMEDVITKGMEQSQTLPRRVVLYLDPPELGRVRVNMMLDSGNQLSVNFIAEHANVRTVLEGHMEQLRGQLIQKGMDVSNLRVEAGGFADFTSPNQGFQQSTPQERWESFKGDGYGMIAAKNMAEEETRQSAPIFRSNTNGRLHLII